MRYRVLFILLLSLSPLSGRCLDPELQKLNDIVHSLKSDGESGFNKARDILCTDPLWTPMNELVADDPSVECRASDRVPGFRLNKLLASAEQAKRFETSTGNMLNGEDARFNYSLYERAIKPGTTAKYTLYGRSGEQTFIIIPFDPTEEFHGEISVGGNFFDKKSYNDGTLTFTGNVPKGEKVTLILQNTSGRNNSFAILNHNSRR